MRSAGLQLTVIMALILTAPFLMAGAARADVRTDGAVDFLSAFINDAVDVLANEELSEEQRILEFRRLFNEGLDVDVISRFVLGRYWKVATPAERQEYRSIFEDYVMAVYARRIGAVTKVEVEIGKARPLTNRGAIISSQIIRKNGEPVDLEWRLRRTENSWRIVDVVVIGVSMAITQRSEFASVISNNGGKVEALLKILRDKIAKKGAGTS